MKTEPKRIAIFGTESTGKTCLAKHLAAHFEEPWAPEYVRWFWEERHGHITPADLGPIARGQIRWEEQAARRARRVLFCDTELLTNMLWAELLYPGHCPAWIASAALRRSHRYALYLLCDTDLAFTPDPQRSFPNPADRQRCRRLWRHTLERHGLPFVEIHGPAAARQRRAIGAVNHIISD